jgi:hypothetical protein
VAWLTVPPARLAALETLPAAFLKLPEILPQPPARTGLLVAMTIPVATVRISVVFMDIPFDTGVGTYVTLASAPTVWACKC